MLNNDTNKKMMLRFKNSKNFDKLVEKLKEEGYFIKKRKCRNSKLKEIRVFNNERCMKDNLYVAKVVYEEYEDIMGVKSEYKQNINYIMY